MASIRGLTGMEWEDTGLGVDRAPVSKATSSPTRSALLLSIGTPLLAHVEGKLAASR